MIRSGWPRQLRPLYNEDDVVIGYMLRGPAGYRFFPSRSLPQGLASAETYHPTEIEALGAV